MINVPTPPADKPSEHAGDPTPYNASRAAWYAHEVQLEAAAQVGLVDEANTINASVISALAAASASSNAAGASETTAQTGSSYKGNWDEMGGLYVGIPSTVQHRGTLWLAREVIGIASTKEPGIDPTWLPLEPYDVADRATVQPTLDLDFARQRFRAYDPATGLADVALSSVLTYTGSGRTFVDARGTLVAQGSNVPRLEFNPATGECLGLSVYGASTNLLLNALANGTNLATQSVTLSAGAHRLSFYGAGTVVLSGAATGTLVGAGEFPTRTGLTFTATAGSVTFTVTGNVKHAMLTTGSFDSPFVPTAGTAVTAPADVPTVTGAAFSKVFNPAGGTLVVVYRINDPTTTRVVAAMGDPTLAIGVANVLYLTNEAIGRVAWLVNKAGVNQASLSPATTITAGQRVVAAASYAPCDFGLAINGNESSRVPTGVVPASTALSIGCAAAGWAGGASHIDGTVARLLYFPAHQAGLQPLSVR